MSAPSLEPHGPTQDALRQVLYDLPPVPGVEKLSPFVQSELPRHKDGWLFLPVHDLWLPSVQPFPIILDVIRVSLKNPSIIRPLLGVCDWLGESLVEDARYGVPDGIDDKGRQRWVHPAVRLCRDPIRWLVTIADGTKAACWIGPGRLDVRHHLRTCTRIICDDEDHAQDIWDGLRVRPKQPPLPKVQTVVRRPTLQKGVAA